MKQSLQRIFILSFILSLVWSQVALSQSMTLTGSTGGTSLAQSTAVYIASGSTITGSGNIEGAKVSIDNYVSGQDILEVSGYSSPYNGIAFSFDNTKGILTFSGNATTSNYQTLLRGVIYKNTSATPVTTTRNITINLGTGLKFETTGHYYDYISSPNITWENAKADAATKNYLGLKGYLVTILSQAEQDFCSAKISVDTWIGGSDADSEGAWEWVTGPDDGKLLSSTYQNWNTLEPNNSGGDESCAEMLSTGKWNDLSSTTTLNGYLIEYGGSTDDPTLDISDVVAVNISIPAATMATNKQAFAFDANWQTLSGSTTYYLDVATDNTFTSMVSGYNNKDVGNVTSYRVEGLNPATTYYYRVRATSEASGYNSNTISLTTLVETKISGSTGGTSSAQNTPVYVASSAIVNGITLNGAIVSISNNFNSAQDLLGIDGTQTGTLNSISYSYDSSKGILTLTGNQDVATYQSIIRKLTYTNTSATPSTASRSITISLNKALPYSANGHYYEFVSNTGITWSNAKIAAEGLNYFGLKGYLATITSAAENDFCTTKLSGDGWMGASDYDVEGTWEWVTGPEAGHAFTEYSYSNWNSLQPDNYDGNEDYAQFYISGKWNDLPNSEPNIKGYVVEYGGSAGDPTLDISDVVTVDFSVPASIAASSIQSNSFQANWQTLAGATTYYLDVATDISFSSILTGYNNKSVGNVTTSKVEGLNPVTTYYYRVRAISSGYNSNVSSAKTLKADQSITFNTLPVKTYGDIDFSPLATASSGLTVSYTTSDPNVATIVDGLIHIVGAGNCTIYADQSGNETYNAAPQASQQLTVNKASLTITADAKTKTYGDDNPPLTIQYSGWKNNESETVLDTKPTASTTVDLSTNVGTYTEAISVSGGSDNNYTLSYVAANMEVTKAMLTVTADAKTKIYGDDNPPLTIQYNGWKNNESETVLDTNPTASTTVDLSTNVGTYTGAISVFGGSDNNYAFSYVAANMEVTKAMLNVTADDKTKIYGDDNPTLTFQYSGWKNNESETVLDTKPSSSTTINQLTSVGTYSDAIVVSGGVDNNYSFSYFAADFTVNQATLTITADMKSKAYGTANPPLTILYSGWKNDDDADDLTTKPTATTTIALYSSAGFYTNAITVSGGVDENYQMVYVSADFEIIKQTQTISFSNLPAKRYGNNPFLLLATTSSGLPVTYTVTNPEIVSVEGNMVTIHDVGTVTISVSQNGNNNYEPASPVSQVLTINRRPLHVIGIIAESKIYDGTTSADLSGATLSGIIGADQVVLENANVGKFVSPGVGNGIIVLTKMTISGKDADKYELMAPSGITANITRKEISVTPNNIETECNSAEPDLTYTFSPNLIGNDSFFGSLTRESGNEPGNYKILQGTLALSNNYLLTFKEGTFSIIDNAPVWITKAAELDRIVEYDNAAELTAAQSLVPVAIDVCDKGQLKIQKETGKFEPNLNCEYTGKYINTWTVTDSRGNKNLYTQIITVADRTAPLVEVLPSVQFTVPEEVCATKITYPEFKITDTCIEKVELISGLGKEGVFPLGTTDELWKVTDKSGNYSFIKFVVTIYTPNVAPVIDQVSDLVVLKNSKQVEIPLSGIDPRSGCQQQEIQSVTAEAGNSELVREVKVEYEQGASTGKLIIKIADNMIGESEIRVRVKDNGGTTNNGIDTEKMVFMLKVEPVTGISHLTNDFDVKVYPNPCSGKVNIEVSSDISSTLRIYSITGAEVYKKEISSDISCDVDLSNNLSGIYFVEIRNAQRAITKKLILRK